MPLTKIGTAGIDNNAITTALIAADTVVAADIAANAVDSSELATGAVDLAHMSVNSIDSDQYVDGSIDLAHMSVNSIDSDQYVDASIDLAHMSVNSIDSDQYVDGSIDTVHIANNAVTGAKIAMTSDAQGDVLYYSGTDYVRLAPGTSGQFLKTLGASANPAWGTVVTDTSGAWTSGTATTGKTLVMGF